MNINNREPSKRPVHSAVKPDVRTVSIVHTQQLCPVLGERTLHRIQSLEVVVTDELPEGRLNKLMEQCQPSPQRSDANVDGDILSLIQRILTPREWNILHQYVVEEKSLREIGRASQPPVSVPRIREIKMKALHKLRHPFFKNILDGVHGRIFTEQVVSAMLKR